MVLVNIVKLLIVENRIKYLNCHANLLLFVDYKTQNKALLYLVMLTERWRCVIPRRKYPSTRASFAHDKSRNQFSHKETGRMRTTRRAQRACAEGA